MRRQLKAALQDRKASTDFGIQNEIGRLQAALSALDQAETAVKSVKKVLQLRHDNLALKLELKRLGPVKFPSFIQQRLHLTSQRLGQLTATKSSGQKNENQSKELTETKRRMTYLSRMMSLFASLLKENQEVVPPGLDRLNDEEAKDLILEKHHDLVAEQLARYLNAEQRALMSVFETLWAKYAVSVVALEDDRASSMTELQGYLTRLGYTG